MERHNLPRVPEASRDEPLAHPLAGAEDGLDPPDGADIVDRVAPHSQQVGVRACRQAPLAAGEPDGAGGHGRGLSFEVPRQSLMTAVTYGVFDDLLIGNFMRTVFHGHWKDQSLYPNFSPYVAKYGDNAGAKSIGELRRYFDAYRERAPWEYLRHQLSLRLHGVFEQGAINTLRLFLPINSPSYRLVRRAYRVVKKPRLS